MGLARLRLGRFTPKEDVSSTHWIGDSVGPRADVGAIEKRGICCPCPRLEPQFLGRSAHSSSLYRVNYHHSILRWVLRKWVLRMADGCNWLRIVSDGILAVLNLRVLILGDSLALLSGVNDTLNKQWKICWIINTGTRRIFPEASLFSQTG